MYTKYNKTYKNHVAWNIISFVFMTCFDLKIHSQIFTNSK